MGSKESKLKKAFEEIDTSGDKKVSVQELADFIDTNKNEKAGEILFKDFSKKEREEFKRELMSLGLNDKNNDGKLSFEEFKEAIKDNDKFKEFVLKMSKDQKNVHQIGSIILLENLIEIKQINCP